MITSLGHLVLTVRCLDTSSDFYCRVLGMREVRFGEGRRALAFGHQKINLHPAQTPYSPHAARPQTGSADLCFLCELPLAEVVARLQHCGVAIEMGPVQRTGATGAILSVYCRDPDGNLIELSNPLD